MPWCIVVTVWGLRHKNQLKAGKTHGSHCYGKTFSAVVIARERFNHHFPPPSHFSVDDALLRSLPAVAVKCHTTVQFCSSFCSWRERGLNGMDVLIHTCCEKATINRLWNSMTGEYCVLEGKLAWEASGIPGWTRRWMDAPCLAWVECRGDCCRERVLIRKWKSGAPESFCFGGAAAVTEG